jgi:predicted phage tail component-like protein
MFEVEYERPGERTGELHVPSSFSLLVNGRNVDSYYSNDYLRIETVNVDGRLTNAYDISTETPAKFDGSMIMSKRMKAKTIDVELLIDVKDESVFKNFLNEFNLRLKNTNYITFKDEQEFTYYVEFEEASVVQQASAYRMNLSFLWHNPVKYKQERVIDYTNAQRLSIDSKVPVEPRIRLVFETGVKQWSMRNTTTDMNINYKHDLVADRYQIDVARQLVTKSVDEVNAMDGLNFSSDLEEFLIKDGDQIVVTPTPKSIQIRYRGVVL